MQACWCSRVPNPRHRVISGVPVCQSCLHTFEMMHGTDPCEGHGHAPDIAQATEGMFHRIFRWVFR